MDSADRAAAETDHSSQPDSRMSGLLHVSVHFCASEFPPVSSRLSNCPPRPLYLSSCADSKLDWKPRPFVLKLRRAGCCCCCCWPPLDAAAEASPWRVVMVTRG